MLAHARPTKRTCACVKSFYSIIVVLSWTALQYYLCSTCIQVLTDTICTVVILIIDFVICGVFLTMYNRTRRPVSTRTILFRRHWLGSKLSQYSCSISYTRHLLAPVAVHPRERYPQKEHIEAHLYLHNAAASECGVQRILGY